MSLPKLHYISQGQTANEHLNNIKAACNAGAELVQLRIKNASQSEVLNAAKEARKITHHFQTRLIINDYHLIAKEVKADGVHLGKLDVSPKIAKTALASWQIIGGTANSLQDCLSLINQGVDYIGLGPYRYTKTKENLSPLLGYEGYLTILEQLQSKTPILAIGGITINDVAELKKTGIYGVAVSGEITKDFNAISAFKTLLKSEHDLEEQVWVPK